MDVQLPDGRILKGVPEGTTKDQLSAKLRANGIELGSPKQSEEYPDILSRRFSEAMASRPDVPPPAKNIAEFMQQQKNMIPNTEKALAAGFNAVASPLGAVGERLEYKAAKEAGVPEDKAQQVAKETGDVSEALIGVVPGIKEVPESGASLVKKATTAPFTKVREAVNAASDTMAKKATPIPEAGDIKIDSQAAYNWFEKQGGTFTPKFTDKFLAEVDKISPQTPEGKIFAGNNEITALVRRAQQLRGQGGYADPYGIASTKPSMSISFKGMEEIDKTLTNQIAKHFKPGIGLDEQGKAIMDFQDKFRDMVDKASGDEIAGGKDALEAYKYARAKWAQAARMRDVEQIISRAELMDNPATAIKTGFRTLYTNTKRIAGFTPEEKAAIKKAAETGNGVDILRTMGSRLIPIAHAASGGTIGGDVMSYMVSKGARNAAEALQMKRADEVRRAVANRNIPKPVMSADQAIGAEVDPLAAQK